MDTTTEIIRRTEDDNSRLSTEIHPLLRKIYSARGILDDSELERELKDLPHPSSIDGIEEAVKILHQAMEQSERILIVGDFDADGATSCTLAMLGLTALGAENVDYLVPNRFDYGYGLTPEIVELSLERSPDLILTVDNGISSIDGVEAANKAGITVVVTDHHLPGRELPDAAAIVNPNQTPGNATGKCLAGVGVMFYVLLALRSRLRQHNWFENKQITEPNMADYLDLVALGTVADVVPLDRINRILVHQGLRRIRGGQCRPGILELLRVSGREPGRIVASDMGFAIGPRLNAAGRLDDISLGIETLLTESRHKAMLGAAELDALNRQRREIEEDMRQQATAHLKTLEFQEDDGLPYGLSIYDPDWHQGVIGILASRIKELYHRPVIAFASTGDGWIKGSARSVPGLHIRDVLDHVATTNPALIHRFGGHAMAAGLTLKEELFDRFRTIFDQEVREHLGPADIKGQIISDGELDATSLNLETAQLLRDAGPWGQHFPEPVFDGVFHLVSSRIVGEKHLKLVLKTVTGELVLDGIAFNQADKLPANGTEEVHAAYRLDINEFRGNTSVQMIIEYLEWL